MINIADARFAAALSVGEAFENLFGTCDHVWQNGVLVERTAASAGSADLPFLKLMNGSYWTQENGNRYEIDTERNVDQFFDHFLGMADKFLGGYDLPDAVLVSPGVPFMQMPFELELSKALACTLCAFAMYGKDPSSLVLTEIMSVDGAPYHIRDILIAHMACLYRREDLLNEDIERIFEELSLKRALNLIG